MTSVYPNDAEARIASAANWFYWIAALSLVNSVVIAMGAEFSFIIGLGVMQFVDGIALSAESQAATIVALVVDALIAGVVVLFGVMARRQKAVMLVGMGLYALDGLIFLLVSDWLSVGFHAFVLFSMSQGLGAFADRVPAPLPEPMIPPPAGSLTQQDPAPAPEAARPAGI